MVRIHDGSDRQTLPVAWCWIFICLAIQGLNCGGGWSLQAITRPSFGLYRLLSQALRGGCAIGGDSTGVERRSLSVLSCRLKSYK